MGKCLGNISVLKLSELAAKANKEGVANSCHLKNPNYTCVDARNFLDAMQQMGFIQISSNEVHQQLDLVLE